MYFFGLTRSCLCCYHGHRYFSRTGVASFRDVLSAIFMTSSSDATTHVIVWTMRLPIALMAIVVGATIG